jgi:hypothetical protein
MMMMMMMMMIVIYHYITTTTTTTAITLYPLCSVVTLIHLKQTMFLGYTVSQLFRAYYSWCTQFCLQY